MFAATPHAAKQIVNNTKGINVSLETKGALFFIRTAFRL
ncbi:hypothetical protein BFV95_3235 [Alteromonas macleodii]|uniref:Uncharacterized protein n=1 Tax=Alteromonas macleodii TaxID=28108 RepID=A0AB36FR08_ALTMA|nr:hypothetical protein BFV95_3235 [Alteromonas macleodii]